MNTARKTFWPCIKVGCDRFHLSHIDWKDYLCDSCSRELRAEADAEADALEKIFEEKMNIADDRDDLISESNMQISDTTVDPMQSLKRNRNQDDDLHRQPRQDKYCKKF